MVVTRLYISSRRAVENSPSKSLNSFRFRLSEALTGVEQMYVSEFAMNWTPLYPNIPQRSSQLKITYKNKTATIGIDPKLRFTYIEARNNHQRDDVFADFSEELNSRLHGSGNPSEFNDLWFGYDFRQERMVMYRSDTSAGTETVTIEKPSQWSMLQRIGVDHNKDSISLDLEPQGGTLDPKNNERVTLIKTRKAKAFPHPPRLSRTEFIYIASNLARGDSAINELALSTNSIIKSIPIPEPQYGSLPNYTATGAISLSHLRGIQKNLRTAQIDLLDDELQPLELTDQSHMNAEIFITYQTAENESAQRPNSVELKLGRRNF